MTIEEFKNLSDEEKTNAIKNNEILAYIDLGLIKKDSRGNYIETHKYYHVSSYEINSKLEHVNVKKPENTSIIPEPAEESDSLKIAFHDVKVTVAALNYNELVLNIDRDGKIDTVTIKADDGVQITYGEHSPWSTSYTITVSNFDYIDPGKMLDY